MKNCAIYSSFSDLEQLIEIVGRTFQGAQINVDPSKTKIEITEKKVFGKTTIGLNIMTVKTEKEKFSGMLNGMYSFFSQIPARNIRVKEKLLVKITTLAMVIGAVTGKDISDKLRSQLLSVTKELEGFMMWGGRQVLDHNGKLIIDLDGNSEVDDFVVTAPSSFLHGNLKITESGLKRKDRTEQILMEKGIPLCKTLPVIVGDEDARIRSTEEIVKRAVALCICALKGECCGTGQPKEETDDLINLVIDQFQAAEFFSPNEKAFIYNDCPDGRDIVKHSWGYESYMVMLWALGYIDELDYPDHICDVPAIVKVMKEHGSYESLLSDAKLRSTGEILDEADLIYRLDWACVDARINNRAVPGNMDGGVVYERHRSLNWLITYMDQDWDDVKTDT